MRSVPPRGSGWVVDSERDKADCTIDYVKWKRGPTRYREVVLTSCHSGEVMVDVCPV